MTSGNVLAIERCSLHDGPGLRTTVFLKGCPLSCLWCHNPESKSFKKELCYFDERCSRCGLCVTVCANHNVNKNEHNINRKDCSACGKCQGSCLQAALEIKGSEMNAQEVIDIALKDERYYKKSGGGLTLSGGEPLAQFEFSLEILHLAKENALHTCLETSGYAPTDRLPAIIPYVDLFLFDFKESSEDAHKKFTGVTRSLIIENLYAVDKAGAKIVLRCPIIPGYNDRDDHFAAIAETAAALQNMVEINIMPYHPMGASKANRVGREYSVSNLDFPTDEEIENWIEKIRAKTDITVKRG